MFQSYKKEDFGPDASCSIKVQIERLLQQEMEPKDIIAFMSSNGCDAEADTSGYVRFTRGKESCDYPLMVTIIQSPVTARESYEVI